MFPQDVQRLVAEYKRWYLSLQPKGGVQTIAVDEVAAKVASFYEKIRGVVDWREEHLLRKTAIERILKRRMLTANKEDFAEPFLQELIRGGHFPNERIPVTKIDQVQKIVEKYLYLQEKSPQDSSERVLAQVQMWLLSVAAAEVEETLAPPIRERALLNFMTEDMASRVAVQNGKPVSKEELDAHITVGVERALFKLDEATITYHLLEQRYENWNTPSPQTLESVSQSLPRLKQELSDMLYHPLAERVYRLMERYDTPYLILGDIMGENPNEFEKLSSDPAQLEAAVQKSYQARLKRLKAKMRRAAIYSTVSVFLSKVLIALAIEIPFDKYITGDFNQTTVFASIAIPSLFMLLLVASTKSSSEENFQRVMIEVMKIVYGKRNGDRLEIAFARKRRPVLEAFIRFMYTMSFLLSFGGISWILWRFSFSIPSIAVFLLFLSLVAFAGTRIRARARELLLGQEKQGFLYTIFDLFSLPVIQFGRWLSRQVVKYNILVVILNFLIEIPFQVFVEFLEHWRSFLREKREEVH